MLRIRLRRMGKKKQPSYRLVVADSRAPRDGAFVEIIGTYNPLTEPATITIDEPRAREWLSKGAVPSERAVRLLASRGIGEAPVYAPKPRKTETAEAPAASVSPPSKAAASPAETPAAEASTPEPTASSPEDQAE